jgi:hypothetical protein
MEIPQAISALAPFILTLIGLVSQHMKERDTQADLESSIKTCLESLRDTANQYHDDMFFLLKSEVDSIVTIALSGRSLDAKISDSIPQMARVACTDVRTQILTVSHMLSLNRLRKHFRRLRWVFWGELAIFGVVELLVVVSPLLLPYWLVVSFSIVALATLLMYWFLVTRTRNLKDEIGEINV